MSKRSTTPVPARAGKAALRSRGEPRAATPGKRARSKPGEGTAAVDARESTREPAKLAAAARSRTAPRTGLRAKRAAGLSPDEARVSDTPAPTVPRELARRLAPEARRAQILAIAENLFSTHPYGELGVPEVARAIGITPGLVYHYFPTKESLLVAAVEQRARELLQFCIPDASLPLLEQVDVGVRGYFDYVEAHSSAYRNLMRGPTASEPEVVRICEHTRVAIVEHFVSAIGMGNKAMPATRLSLRAYLGFAEHAIMQWLERRQVVRATLERMCRGMMIAAFRLGLASDANSPLSLAQLALFEDAYRKHFDVG